MGLREELNEMYRRLGVMDERLRQVETLGLPKKGEVAKDLEKAKNQKDFDKKKKDWQDKVDKGTKVLKDLDSSFDTFTDQIKKADSANNREYQDTSYLTVIDDRITQMQDAAKALKPHGQGNVYDDAIARLQEARKSYLETKKNSHEATKREIAAMWKAYNAAQDKHNEIRNALNEDKDILKSAAFGSKGKVKAGR
jgi:hypothetical protein